MHHVSRKVVLGVVAALALAVLAAPAGAHKGKGSGKKAMGTIASFDGTTLSVTTTDGEAVTAVVDDDTRIKLEHRGHHGRGKGHGNPTTGTLEDLSAGTSVLDMKVTDEGTLDKIKVRPGDDHEAEPSETPAETPTPEPTETPTPDPTEAPTPDPTTATE